MLESGRANSEVDSDALWLVRHILLLRTALYGAGRLRNT
jgi:hypothetical protein